MTTAKPALFISEVPRRRWRIAFLLGLGVLVNYFDRVNLSVSHNDLYATFGISDITFGYLLAAYNWSYALCQLPIGVLLDRFGVRLVGRISTFVWSLASFAAAITPSIGGFFAARLLLGIGEAPTFPANAKAIGYWFPPRERSLATSIFDSAAKFAPAIGVPLIGILLLHVGWRLSFAATGMISFLYFLLFYWIYRDPKDDPELSAEELAYIRSEDTLRNVEVGDAEQASLGYLLGKRKVIGLALGFGSYNYVFYLLLTWLPSYLSRSLNIDLLHSFLYTGVPWLVATFTDLIVGGWLVDALIQRGWNASLVRRVVLIGGTALGLGILGAADAHTPIQALFWISLSIGGLSAAAPVGWSIPSLIAPRASVGTLGGILNFANQISGIAAPILTGYLVTAQHSFGLAFGVAAVYLAIGIAGYVFLLGDIQRIPGESHLAL
ncbi:MFS transporter [Alloacidobacterium dinghuense]|uniref:MFS transporter n=1 Tax=Alloacidobacterium dinghuense TaxID=2763107 RepID=A0A7G8BKE1_9BACT|nr:MFS transporter [Alloacidobacterium dinghuense]QNI33011.1 MFS transporter [Alloacidobacterium dinghuense]